MGWVEEGVRVLQHVDEIGLEADRHGVADIEDTATAFEQAHDRGVDVERAAPDDPPVRMSSSRLARRLVGTLGIGPPGSSMRQIVPISDHRPYRRGEHPRSGTTV